MKSTFVQKTRVRQARLHLMQKDIFFKNEKYKNEFIVQGEA